MSAEDHLPVGEWEPPVCENCGEHHEGYADCPAADEMDSNWMDVHAWFGLSYSSYLCVNRSLLQSMPDEWQLRFYKLMDELADYFPNIREPHYTVYARNPEGTRGAGRFIKDPIPHYNRGRTLILPTDTYGSAPRECWRCRKPIENDHGEPWEPICDECFRTVTPPDPPEPAPCNVAAMSDTPAPPPNDPIEVTPDGDTNPPETPAEREGRDPDPAPGE